MSRKITRRGVLLGGAQVAAASGLATLWPGAGGARAAMEEITIVEWGGPYVDGMKQLIERQGKYDVTWELHAGGSASILPKIKAQWPDRMLYDLVAGWPPVWLGMIREGWAEPLTVEAVPNLAHVPEALITKDKSGTWYGTPRNTAVSYFGYRPDICPIEINSVEDFLSPKLKGQICWPDPVYNTNMQMVGLALANGGDEFNLEPGWELLKEIAKAGNIGRVFKTEVDMINSLSTGETSITFGPSGNWVQLARKLPITHLNKHPGAGLKASLATEGWCVMKKPEHPGRLRFRQLHARYGDSDVVVPAHREPAGQRERQGVRGALTPGVYRRGAREVHPPAGLGLRQSTSRWLGEALRAGDHPAALIRDAIWRWGPSSIPSPR